MTIRRFLLRTLSLPAIFQAQVAPPWIKVLPERTGHVYALGSAPVTSSEAKALELAAQNARFEVIARLRVAVQGSTVISTTSTEQRSTGSAATGTRQQSVRQDGTTSVQAMNLPGLVIEERYMDRRGATAYALAYLDSAVAERSLVDQVGALEADWTGLKADEIQTGLRPSITRLQRIKALQIRATELESQAALLIPAGLPTSVRSGVQGLGREMSREITAVQKFLTMGAKVQGGDLGQDVVALMRNTAIKQGFIWTQKDPAINLVIELRGAKQNVNIYRKTWWDVDASTPDIVGTRASIRISISDASGDVQDSFDMAVKGVGVDVFSSEQALLRELKRTLPARFQAFLTELLK